MVQPCVKGQKRRLMIKYGREFNEIMGSMRGLRKDVGSGDRYMVMATVGGI